MITKNKSRSFFLQLILSIILLFAFKVNSQPPGYTYGKHVLVDAAQVSGGTDLNNFPVLIDYTSNDLRHTSSGGNVENINGFDIVFYAGDCNTQLNHEIELYNPTTGNIIAWVQIPVLSASSNTGFQMYYGNSSVGVNPSTAATWSVGYDGVWHLHNNFNDASGNGNNGVNNGSTNSAPAHIADGQNFVDPNHWIELPSHNARGGSFSYSAWFNSSAVNRAGQRVICDDASNGNGCHAISLGDPGSGRVRFYIRGMNPVSLDSPNLIANNTWNYVTAVFDQPNMVKHLYINGNLAVSANVTGTLGAAAGNASIGGEVASGETGNRFMGDIDEVRSFNGVLSADWVSTEYNNQSSPSTFYNIGGQMLAGDLCALLPVELIHFEVSANDNNKALLNWTTASENNNDYFEVQKSTTGNKWETIGKVSGMGSTNTEVNYEFTDPTSISGLTYYRLKQVDFNGEYEFSPLRSIELISSKKITVYPNPAQSIFIIEGYEGEVNNINLFNVLGESMNKKVSIKRSNGTMVEIDASVLPKGTYILRTPQGTNKILIH